MTRRFLVLLIVLTAVGGGVMAGASWHDRFMVVTVPPVDAADPVRPFIDDTPVRVTVAAGGFEAVWDTTAQAVRHSPALWKRMHLANWNDVPVALRHDGLNAMLAHYQPLLADPAVWDGMGPSDWDEVPQPIRTVAYRAMVDYWTGYYDIGGRYDLRPGLVAETLAAIVMSESWFDHRAQHVNRDGSVDLGLGMASEYARVRLRQLHASGAVDVSFEDAAYLNPWVGTQFAALWFSLLLDEARGDLALAVRAYNRGISAANDAIGTSYLAAVQRRLTRFIQNRSAPPAWYFMWHRARQHQRLAWPWLRPGPGASDEALAGSVDPGEPHVRARLRTSPCCL